MAIDNSNGNGNGQWQWCGNGNGDGNRDGNSDHNDNRDGDGNSDDDGNGNGNNDVVITKTLSRVGCLYMCRQCATLWQGQRLASPPWTQMSVHCPVLRHGGATAKSVCSISRGRDPESSSWIVFLYFFQLPVRFTN